jgi:hypothetical protein
MRSWSLSWSSLELNSIQSCLFSFDTTTYLCTTIIQWKFHVLLIFSYSCPSICYFVCSTQLILIRPVTQEPTTKMFSLLFDLTKADILVMRIELFFLFSLVYSVFFYQLLPFSKCLVFYRKLFSWFGWMGMVG